MSEYKNTDFMLHSDLAVTLYQEYAAKMPIIDYHCHLDPVEIAEDKNYDNITQIWLNGDHYKWRLLRQNGISENLITEKDSDYERFVAWAKTLEFAVGNPLYHWSHLELANYFGYEGELNGKTAKDVWDMCNETLKSGTLSTRKIITTSNVTCIGTTDDPIDHLLSHQKIEQDSTFSTKVIPTFRPDLAMQIEQSGFVEYVEKLSNASGIIIKTYQDLLEALCNRMDFFQQSGCVSSDHSFSNVPFTRATEAQVEQIFQKALQKSELTNKEQEEYRTELLLFFGREYAKRQWVMQLHFGVVRNTNSRMFQMIGKDTGYDRILGSVNLEPLAQFLDCLNSEKSLPKTILYSLNPNDNAAIDTLCGCFHETEIRGKVQHGAAWWFNDHQFGMESHMQGLAQSGLLAVSVGMLTDSRSVLSYARHDYFRRILCEFIAKKVNAREFPLEKERLGKMIEDISYYNTKAYFNLTV